MERLTTNKEVSEMNVIELAHNSCYGKDRNARYRDYETDTDARELTIKLLEQYADIPNEFTCDDDFDDFMADSLQYGTDDILGLIAVFYRNLCAMANLRGRLKYYEDLEEHGKLLKLQFKVGNNAWIIRQTVSNSLGMPVIQILNPPHKKRVSNITISNVGILYHVKGRSFSDFDIGRDVFFSKEEAETALQALKETEGKNE